jgi:tyrosyl-tRNA synthetase
MCHGDVATQAAAETARRTFEEGAAGEALPTVEFHEGQPLFVYVSGASLASSNSEARRLIRQGSVRVNDRLVTDEKRVLTLADLGADGVIKLTKGKKRHALVRMG